jgi:hypothetical protein
MPLTGPASAAPRKINAQSVVRRPVVLAHADFTASAVVYTISVAPMTFG